MDFGALGFRKMDLERRQELAPPPEIVAKYSIKFLKSFIKENKKEGNYINIEDPDNLLKLNTGQQEVMDHVEEFLKMPIAQAKKKPMQFILTGVAGAGKTLLLKRISKRFQEVGRSIIMSSPYGSVASMIGGFTCHSLFEIPYKGISFEKLATRIKKSQTLMDKFKNLDCIVIDEFYNLSPSFLHYISMVLSIIRDNPLPFGSISLLLAGDVLQLAPVASHSLWTDQSKLNTFQRKGSDLYRGISKVFFLNESLRSVDEDFAKLLLHIRQKRMTYGDLESLRSRREVCLSDSERSTFSDSPRIFPRNKFSREFNRQKVGQLEGPVFLLKPCQVPAFPVITEECDEIPIAKGALCRLNSNLDLAGKLSTGALGEIAGILFDPDRPEDYLPAIVFVRYKNIRAKTPEGGLTPIPTTSEYTVDPTTLKSFKITSFPLTLNYAYSVHLAQGSSLSKLVIYLDYKEMFVNSSYVSIGRSQGGLSSIMFLDKDITEARFQNNAFYAGYDEILAEYKRLKIDHYLLGEQADDGEENSKTTKQGKNKRRKRHSK